MNPHLKFERSAKEYVILALSLAASIGMLPFAVHRIATQDWGIAVLDTFSVSAMLCMFAYVYKTRRTETASWLLALLFLATEVFTVALKGPGQIVWSFPATVGIYYLVSAPKAIVINFAGMTAIYLLTLKSLKGAEQGAFLVSLFATNVFTIVFAVRNSIQKRELEKLTLKDPLTGVNNRRAFELFLDTFDTLKTDPHQHASLIIFDLDHFKRVNDQHGHVAGDKALAKIVTLVHTQLHHDEKLYRIGGEEFVIAPLNLDLAAAFDFAERLRKIIEHSSVNDELGLTVSLGVADYQNAEAARDWLHRADEALYEAKRAGRNQCAKAGRAHSSSEAVAQDSLTTTVEQTEPQSAQEY